MLTCEGYKMFKGRARVRFLRGNIRELDGVWLYRPDTDMWYLNGNPDFRWGSSFYREDVEILSEEM